MDSRRAQVVELRDFGGLTVEETAHVLKLDAANGDARLEACSLTPFE